MGPDGLPKSKRTCLARLLKQHTPMLPNTLFLLTINELLEPQIHIAEEGESGQEVGENNLWSELQQFWGKGWVVSMVDVGLREKADSWWP
jgi:hypothetical protein